MSQTTPTMKSSSEYRLQAREHLSGNWGKFALLYLIIGAASIGASLIPFIGSIAQLILTGPVTLGIVICMLKLMQEEPVALEDVLEGFKNFVPALLIYILTMVFTILWTLLFIIPGIIAAYSYSMCFYILRENPDMAPMDVIRKSKEMMKGHKMELFILQLTFIGWGLLSILTLGIGSLWLIPYVTASTTAFYLDLRGGQATSWQDPSYIREEPRYTDDSSRFSDSGARFLYDEPRSWDNSTMEKAENTVTENAQTSDGADGSSNSAPDSTDSGNNNSTFF